jgi:type I restriction enzyme, R subunit
MVPGIRFTLCYFKPASALEPKRVHEYEANILSVMRQVRYSLKSENAIDTVLFINGIPVATLEIKNILTGSTFRHAERQYRVDRAPAGEPLLTFKRGALVHFALDEDNVSMTTRLSNGKTRFLPFNRGRAGGAGNDDIEGEFRVAYLYREGNWGKAIFSRDVLLDVIGRFMHLESNEREETMIFPRFQQLDAVRKIMAHARSHGAVRTTSFSIRQGRANRTR